MEIRGEVSASARPGPPQRGSRVGVQAVGPRRQCKKDGHVTRRGELHLSVSLCFTVAFLFSVPCISAHPNSVSHADFSLEGGTVHAIVRLPLDDVDLLLRLDRDLDNQVSGAELDQAKPAIAAYVAKHLRVAVDGASAAHTLDRVGVWRDPSAFQFLESGLTYGTGTTGHLSIHSDFLTELYPSHQTVGRIRANGREDRFMFKAGATYDRRIAADSVSTCGIVAVGLALLGFLWVVRRRHAAATAALMLIATAAAADVIMSAAGLNATLKTMERLTRDASVDARFQLAVEADGLASLMNQEVESHGMQERELLDLALSRTKELGVTIVYNREKKKFFYDGAGFKAYLEEQPRGTHAAAAEFALLSYQFYQSTAVDAAALIAAAEAKKHFLARYPRFEGNAELRLFLAVDYQDLYRRSRDAHDSAGAAMYQRLMRAECLRIERLYPRSEQADAARQMLRRLGNDR